jgi:hypothetical protein
VRRAITDIRSSPPEESGLLARVMGPGVGPRGAHDPRPAAELGRLLEEYMVRVECMQVHRRFPDRTRYVRDTSFAAGIERFARQFGTRDPRLDLKQLDVAVAASTTTPRSWSSPSTSAGDRAGCAGAGVAGHGAQHPDRVAFALATPRRTCSRWPRLPISAACSRRCAPATATRRGKKQEKLESFLDRLEHGEVRVPPPETAGPTRPSGSSRRGF